MWNNFIATSEPADGKSAFHTMHLNKIGALGGCMPMNATKTFTNPNYVNKFTTTRMVQNYSICNEGGGRAGRLTSVEGSTAAAAAVVVAATNSCMSTSDIILKLPNLECNRQRQLSNTESEDSFIIFFDDEEANNCCDSNSEISDEETYNSGFEDESEESYKEMSKAALLSKTPLTSNKKVRFADDDLLCEVHPMIHWSFAYQQARKGHWEEFARDRERFKNRIYVVGQMLGKILSPGHRQNIYDIRFKDC